jgi:hypothetical protein
MQGKTNLCYRQRSETVEQVEQGGLFRTVPTTEGTGSVGSIVPLEQTVEQVQEEEEIDFDAGQPSYLG